MTAKTFGWVALVVAVAFAAGWLLGATGRSTVAEERRVTGERADFAEARALLRAGQVSLYRTNFGDASRDFEATRAVVERLQRSVRIVGQAERAGRFEIALSHVRDAQRLAASLDQAAMQAAEDALAALTALQPAPAPSGSSPSTPR